MTCLDQNQAAQEVVLILMTSTQRTFSANSSEAEASKISLPRRSVPKWVVEEGEAADAVEATLLSRCSPKLWLVVDVAAVWVAVAESNSCPSVQEACNSAVMLAHRTWETSFNSSRPDLNRDEEDSSNSENQKEKRLRLRRSPMTEQLEEHRKIPSFKC